METSKLEENIKDALAYYGLEDCYLYQDLVPPRLVLKIIVSQCDLVVANNQLEVVAEKIKPYLEKITNSPFRKRLEELNEQALKVKDERIEELKAEIEELNKYKNYHDLAKELK